jgi:hypothetical protein
MKKHARFWLAASVLLSASALLAYDVGDKAYTKKLETTLLEEPKPFSNPVAKISYAAELECRREKTLRGPQNGFSARKRVGDDGQHRGAPAR